MFKTVKEFDAAIKNILVQFRDGTSTKELNPSIDDEDTREALAECIDRKHLSGISYRRTLDGKPHFDEKNIRVTYSGLSFIESH